MAVDLDVQPGKIDTRGTAAQSIHALRQIAVLQRRQAQGVERRDQQLVRIDRIERAGDLTIGSPHRANGLTDVVQVLLFWSRAAAGLIQTRTRIVEPGRQNSLIGGQRRDPS